MPSADLSLTCSYDLDITKEVHLSKCNCEIGLQFKYSMGVYAVGWQVISGRGWNIDQV